MDVGHDEVLNVVHSGGGNASHGGGVVGQDEGGTGLDCSGSSDVGELWWQAESANIRFALVLFGSLAAV